MKKTEDKKQYFFVDEAGDPTFYNKYGKLIVGSEGCSKTLLIGLIRTSGPDSLRKAIFKLREEIKQDKYLENIPSIEKTLISFHAKDDSPEVREKFYKLISGLDFKAEFVVARKIESVFKSRHKGKENVFYDDIFAKLFERKLHKTKQNIIYYAVRGNKNRQSKITEALQTAILSFENKWKIKVESEVITYPQTPSGEPCLQIIDYMSWAVQRAFEKGEDRYLRFVEEKISFLVDIYDFKKYPKNFYSRSNKFDLTKISKLDSS